MSGLAAGWGAPWGAGSPSSSYAPTKIPKFVYTPNVITIGSSNNVIPFAIGGGALAATIASGTYTPGDLALYAKIALEAADSTGTYTGTYDYSTGKFTLARSSGTFSLDVGGSASDALPTLGFASDKSGALTYTSDSAVPTAVTFTCVQYMKDPQVEEDDSVQTTRFENGRQETAYYGCTQRLTFELEFETEATVQSLRAMWEACGRYKTAVNFYPDSTTSDYFTALLEPTSFRPRRMSRDGLPLKFRIDFALLFRVPAGGNLTAASFDSRHFS